MKIMIRGFGIDSVGVKCTKKIVEEGDRFAKRTLIPGEFAQYQQLKGKRKVGYLGGRFSLKESFSKAPGADLGKYVGFQDIETLQDDLGHPIVMSTRLSGNIFASIMHDDHEIIIGVVLEELD